MTSDPLPDTWHSRELPVLRAAARLLEKAPIGQVINLSDITTDTGMDSDDAIRALIALGEGDLIDVEYKLGSQAWVRRISAEGRRKVGQWPSEATALDRIITALEAIAENTDDTDTRTNARKFADWLRAGGTTVGLSVATAAITGQIPGAGK